MNLCLCFEGFGLIFSTDIWTGARQSTADAKTNAADQFASIQRPREDIVAGSTANCEHENTATVRYTAVPLSDVHWRAVGGQLCGGFWHGNGRTARTAAHGRTTAWTTATAYGRSATNGVPNIRTTSTTISTSCARWHVLSPTNTAATKSTATQTLLSTDVSNI